MNNSLGLRIVTNTLAGVMTISMVACGKPADTTDMPDPSTTVGTQIDDSVITAKVKTALLNDSSIKSLDISVNTRAGEVQLSGFVDNQAQMDRAVEVAQGMEGVTQVTNQMSIKK